MLSDSALGINGVPDISPSSEPWIQARQQITTVEFLHLLHFEDEDEDEGEDEDQKVYPM